MNRGPRPQVVYFHNAQYERIARIPFARVGEGDPLHVLPALMQLYPDVELRYEEDALDLVRGPGRWCWLAVPGRICHPRAADPAFRCGRVQKPPAGPADWPPSRNSCHWHREVQEKRT